MVRAGDTGAGAGAPAVRTGSSWKPLSHKRWGVSLEGFVCVCSCVPPPIGVTGEDDGSRSGRRAGSAEWPSPRAGMRRPPPHPPPLPPPSHPASRPCRPASAAHPALIPSWTLIAISPDSCTPTRVRGAASNRPRRWPSPPPPPTTTTHVSHSFPCTPRTLPPGRPVATGRRSIGGVAHATTGRRSASVSTLPPQSAAGKRRHSGQPLTLSPLSQAVAAVTSSAPIGGFGVWLHDRPIRATLLPPTSIPP